MIHGHDQAMNNFEIRSTFEDLNTDKDLRTRSLKSNTLDVVVLMIY